MIQVQHLTKRFGYQTVLKDLNFSADQGELVTILGPNGAGKTTFLRILATLISPTKGSITIAGINITQNPTVIRRKIGVVLDQPQLYNSLNAVENLTFYGNLYGLPELQNKIKEVLTLVGLKSDHRESVKTYSRGMKQRLTIARALLHQPDLLLLDEPYNSLDPSGKKMLNRILIKFIEQSGTVIMVNHEPAHIGEIPIRYEILINSRIAAQREAADLPVGGALQFYEDTLTAAEGN